MCWAREKLNSCVLIRGDFWTIRKCHGILCFNFYFLFRSNGNWEQVDENMKLFHDENNFRCCYGFFFFFESAIPNVFDHSYYDAPWRQYLKDILQLKILQTWINIDVVPAPRHLTYYCMLLLLSNKPSL